MKNKIIILLLTLSSLMACSDDNIRETFVEQDTPPILVYLQNEAEYSEWYKLLKRSGTADAYGFSTVPMTFFIAKNDAVLAYLESKDWSSVEDVPVEEAKFLIQYHTIPKMKYELKHFRDGKLSEATATTDYLSCRLEFEAENEDDNGVYINSVSKIIWWDIIAVNGVMQVLDKVIDPIRHSIFDHIALDDRYSILEAAYLEAGLDSLLRAMTRPEIEWDEEGGELPFKMSRTLLATSDSIFKRNGINTVADLKRHLGAGDDVMNLNNDLNQYLRYKILDRDYSTAQFALLLTELPGDRWGLTNKVDPNGIVIPTMSENNMLAVKPIGLNYLLNNKVEINKDYSNIQARNGFIQEVNGLLEIEEPEPVFTYIEPGDYYYCDNITGYRHQNFPATKTTIDKRDVRGYMDWTSVPAEKKDAVSYQVYTAGGYQLGDFFGFRFGDGFILDLGVIGEFTMKTNPIPKGTYSAKFWLRTVKSTGGMMQAYIDGESIGPVLNGWNSGIDERVEVDLGYVSFDKTESHELTLKVVSAGTFTFDGIRLTPHKK